MFPEIAAPRIGAETKTASEVVLGSFCMVLLTNDQRRTTNDRPMIQTLEWTDNGVRFIDQTKLPTEETYVTCKTYEQVADVIRTMVVRGAPAIGVAAAMGIALG